MDEPAASRRAAARTKPRAEPDGMDIDDDARGGGDHARRPADEPATTAPVTGQLMSRTGTSGAKGFAIIFGAMVGIIGLLWLIATLVAPH